MTLKTDLLFLVFVWLVNAGLAIPQIGKPFGPQEGTSNIIPAKYIYLSGHSNLSKEMPHPPFYHRLLALNYKLFGLRQESARMPGLLCSFLLLLFMWLRCRPVIRSDILKVAMLFLALSPVFIQGSLLVFLDNTVLTLAMTIFLFEFVNKESNIARPFVSAYLGILLMFAFWCKLISPLVFFAVLPVYFLYRQKSKAEWFGMVNVIVIGFVGFLVSYYLYTLWSELSFTAPFYYLFDGAATTVKSKLSLIVNFPVQFAQLAFWWGPGVLILFIYNLGLRLNAFIRSDIKKFEPWDMLAIFVLSIIGIYFFAGGLSYGFPQWQSVAFPAFCVFATKPLEGIIISRKTMVWVITAILLTALFFAGFVGDPILTIRWDVRKIMAFGGSLANITGKLFWQIFIYCIIPFLICVCHIYKIISKRFFVIFFVIFCLGYGLAINLSHLKTRTLNAVGIYGETGTREVISLIRQRLRPGDTVIATREIVGDLMFLDIPFRDAGFRVWEDTSLLKEELKKLNTRFFCYSFTANTIEQYKRITKDAELQNILEYGFILHNIGGYSLWIKKGVEKT